jgi:hypothetical protein
MLDSVRKTTAFADVAVYIDEDQTSDYTDIPDWVHVYYGPRIGQCRSLDHLVKKMPGYTAYGAATDDSAFVTPGWDQWVLKTCKALPGGIGLIAPFSGGDGERMDFPWATGKWVQAVGSFTLVGTHHSYWDVALQMLAESVEAMAFAQEDEFKMWHEALLMGDGKDTQMNDVGKLTYLLYHVHNDARIVCVWCAHERLHAIRTLRDAIRENS